MKKGDFSKDGFTVIEVVLVLAVAGLIFAMAFIAVPSLQRSQRDNARRDDITKFITEVKRYQTSNRGNLPSGTGDFEWNESWKDNGCPSGGGWSAFYCSYLGGRFADPVGYSYKLKVVECGANNTDGDCTSTVKNIIDNMNNKSFDANNYTMLVVARGKCNGSNIIGSSSPRNLAVLYRLEGSGTYCYGT